MNLSALIKQPLFWLACGGVGLVLVLAFWYVKRPVDATGRSLILGRRESRNIQKDLAQQAAQRHHDSVAAGQAQSAATVLYQQGQQQEKTALRLHHQTHEKRPSTDTSAQRLQQLLTNY